jgi:hypothetical protein
MINTPDNMGAQLWAEKGLTPWAIDVHGQDAKRTALLEHVTVTDEGIAVCQNRISGAVLKLAAVRLDDQDDATHVPIEQDEEEFQFPLPGNVPSKIGFFICGIGRPGIKLSAAIRIGTYPGVPTITGNLPFSHTRPPRELLLQLGGIRPDERDNQKWADQIGIEHLGFDPHHTRGFFHKRHMDEQHGGAWKRQSLIAQPEPTPDPSPKRLNTNILQFLTYEETIRRRRARRPIIPVAPGQAVALPRAQSSRITNLQGALEIRVVPES